MIENILWLLNININNTTKKRGQIILISDFFAILRLFTCYLGCFLYTLGQFVYIYVFVNLESIFFNLRGIASDRSSISIFVFYVMYLNSQNEEHGVSP